MLVREAQIEEREKWNNFVEENDGNYLQSWEWADFYATQKDKIWRFVVESEGKEWKAVVFLFKSKSKIGPAVIFVPRGPVFAAGYEKIKVFTLLLRRIESLAKEERVGFFQIDIDSNDEALIKVLRDCGFNKAGRDILPRYTLILDLTLAPEEIFAQMHEKTRYNIRVAEKRGIEVFVDNGQLDEFMRLLEKTEKRQKIKLFQRDYFEKMLTVPFVKLYLARLDRKIICANIVLSWGKTATYLFGAFDYEFRSAMAPYLLQWRAICDAKKNGLSAYDFWGVAPEKAEGRLEHWQGFTKFKRGFAPQAALTEYAGTHEKIYWPASVGIHRFLRRFFKAIWR